MKPVIGMIPLWDDEKDSIWMLPGYMDGISEAGGHDVSSELYHEEPLEGLVEYCEKRDAMEEIVLAKALMALWRRFTCRARDFSGQCSGILSFLISRMRTAERF